MNRELKFRAWIEQDRKMYTVISLSAKFINEDFHRVFINKEASIGEPTNYRMDGENVLMQYTGLKDKNGKEIYEGDIVEAIMNHHGKPTSLKFNAKIIYNDNIGSFQISYLNINNHFVNDDIWLKYFLTVIGNIYANPELLA